MKTQNHTIIPLLTLFVGLAACDAELDRPHAGAGEDPMGEQCDDPEPEQPDDDGFEVDVVPVGPDACVPVPEDLTKIGSVEGSIDLDQGIDEMAYVGAVEFETAAGRPGTFRLEVGPDGTTDASWEIDGVLVATTRYEAASEALVQWSMPGLDADASATLVSANVIEAATNDLLKANEAAPVPLFPCSDFGKSAVKGFKYALYGIIGAGVAACCSGSLGAGCIICGGVGGAGGEAAGDALDDYCD